jgi:hypothetical protein
MFLAVDDVAAGPGGGDGPLIRDDEDIVILRP